MNTVHQTDLRVELFFSYSAIGGEKGITEGTPNKGGVPLFKLSAAIRLIKKYTSQLTCKAKTNHSKRK